MGGFTEIRPHSGTICPFIWVGVVCVLAAGMLKKKHGGEIEQTFGKTQPDVTIKPAQSLKPRLSRWIDELKLCDSSSTLQETHQALADKKQLHVVEFQAQRGPFPVVVASPKDGAQTDPEPEDEIPNTRLHWSDVQAAQGTKRSIWAGVKRTIW